MRTSLEIPDPLFKEAKRLALERNTTLKNLVTEGLQLVLQGKKRDLGRPQPDSTRLPKVRPKGNGLYKLDNMDVERILAEEEASQYGRPR